MAGRVTEQRETKLQLAKQKTIIQDTLKQLTKKVIEAISSVVIKTYENQIEELANELEFIDRELLLNIDYTAPLRTAMNEVLQVLESPCNVWKNYDIHQKQRFYSLLCTGNISHSKKDGVRTANYALPIKLFELLASNGSVDVDSSGFEPLTSSVQMRRSTN